LSVDARAGHTFAVDVKDVLVSSLQQQQPVVYVCSRPAGSFYIL